MTFGLKRYSLNRRKKRRPVAPVSLGQLSGLAVALAVVVGALQWQLTVRSASVTGAQEKLAVTNGVLTVVPGRFGDSALEVGHAGRDIASTGNIFLRPNSSNAGTKFSGANADLGLTGRLEVQGGISLGGVTKSVWPTGGDPYWKLVGSTVQPVTPGYGFSANSYDVRISGNDPSQPTVRLSNPGGMAWDVSWGWLTVAGNIDVTGGFTIGGPWPLNPPVTVWTSANDGQGSSLGADRLDGSNVAIVACGERPDVGCVPGYEDVPMFCRIQAHQSSLSDFTTSCVPFYGAMYPAEL